MDVIILTLNIIESRNLIRNRFPQLHVNNRNNAQTLLFDYLRSRVAYTPDIAPPRRFDSRLRKSRKTLLYCPWPKCLWYCRSF